MRLMIELDSLFLLSSVSVPACQHADFLLALHESKKALTHPKGEALRNERYLPALTASVMRHVLEPLTKG